MVWYVRFQVERLWRALTRRREARRGGFLAEPPLTLDDPRLAALIDARVSQRVDALAERLAAAARRQDWRRE